MVVLGLFASINHLLTPRVELGWLRSEPEAVSRARAQGRPMVVDFSAEWCLPCKEMELKVFSSPEVSAALQDFVLLKVDLTREDEDEALPRLKERYGVQTLPAVRIVSPGGKVVGSVNQLVEPPDFLRALDRGRS
jgi:thiol:disulfide interchange protein DsbD